MGSTNPTEISISFGHGNICSYTARMAPHALAEAASLPSRLPLPGTRSAMGPADSRARPTPTSPPALGPLVLERILPVLPELARLFPSGGLPRGGTVLLGPAPALAPDFPPGPASVASGLSSAMTSPAPGLTSLLLSLLAGASSRGYWCAVVGLPALGFAAAAELGVDLGRLILVPHPGSEGRWQSVVATLLETVDLVCLAPGTSVRPADARRLTARARERCSTLLVLDGARVGSGVPGRPGRTGAWPGPSDLRCGVRTSSWSGLGRGHGLLSSRQLEAEVGGRGAASRPRRALLQLPA